MRRWPVLLAALLFLLSGCAPQARELDGMALVRVLGVDGGEEVTLTAVCGGTDQGDVSRGAASAADFQSARQPCPGGGGGAGADQHLLYYSGGRGGPV